jgi:hypothetical protein
LNIEFENDFQQKIMLQTFTEATLIASKADVLKWRTTWMNALTKWHSPYKLVVDATNLTLEGDDVKAELEVALKFFNGFFLKKAVAFGLDTAKGHELLPFEAVSSKEDAYQKIGLRLQKERDPTDFRSNIQIQNHFRQHVMELSFIDPVVISNVDQINVLKSKMTNNLMQWHSKWSLLVDCTNMEVDPEIHPEFEKIFKFFRGFFMKEVLGYSPKGKKETYPFVAYRSRHKAAGQLEGEGNFSGDDADCLSRKTPTT